MIYNLMKNHAEMGAEERESEKEASAATRVGKARAK